jgi:hypothetical protein
MARDKSRAEKTRGPKPVSDAYTGLLVLALLAQIAGAVFLYLDYSQYPEGTSPPKVQVRPAATTQQATPANPNQPNNPAGDPNGMNPKGNMP